MGERLDWVQYKGGTEGDSGIMLSEAKASDPHPRRGRAAMLNQ